MKSPADIRKAKNMICKARNANRQKERREAAEERVRYWRSLTPQKQLRSLDYRLGKGVGAKKQRAKIKAQIDLAGK